MLTVRAAVTAASLSAVLVSSIACSSRVDPTIVVGFGEPNVLVTGSGQVSGTADTLIADVAIASSAPDVTTAMNAVAGRRQALLDALSAAGVDRRDVDTSQGSAVQPQDARASAYRVVEPVMVAIRALDGAPALLGVIAAGGPGPTTTRVNAVSLAIADSEPLLRDAREQAFHDAERTAQKLAALSGRRLGRLLQVSPDLTKAGSQPRPLAVGTRPAQLVLAPGQQMVRFTTTATWVLS